MERLTLKQSAFVREYLIDRNGTQAATRAGYSEKTANEQASRLLANVNIQAALAEGEKAHAKRCNISVDSLTKELESDRELARNIEQPSPAITATMGIAKLHGLVEEKHRVTGSVTVEIIKRTYED